jgi:hypothetical protein
MVYCLHEEYDPRGVEQPPLARGFRGEMHELGPLEVGLRWEPAKQQLQHVKEITRAIRNPPVLYQALVPLRRSGKAKLTIYSPGGGELAWTAMAVAKADPSPWQRFATVDWTAEKPAATAAVPADRVVPKVEEERPVKDEKDLPLAPAAPLLKLSLKDGVFLIDAGKQEMEDRPEELLLARWWVDGEPAAMDVAREPRQMAEARKVEYASQMKVAFGLPANLAGVRVGDKLTLQVMYSPDGFEPAEPEQQFQRLMRARRSDGVGLAISNKLEFTVTEAMLQRPAE